MTAREKSWRYSAEDASGAVVSGSVTAPDERAARSMLASKRLLPLSLSEARTLDLERFGVSTRSQSLSLTELTAITQRLRDLLTAGIPITHALRLASEQAQSAREKAFLSSLLSDVRTGRSLTEALQRNEFSVPRLTKALIEAGESLGTLDKQVQRLAVHYDESLKLRREIIGQLVYPTALTVLIFATMLFLSFLVLPQFEGIFASADATPPPETQFVLAAGAVIRHYWWAAPVIVVGAVFGLRFAARRFASQFENARLAMPFAGRLLRYAEIGRYVRTLATLLEGGSPLAKAMPLARQTLSLRILQQEFEAAENAVRTGERLAPALKRLTSTPGELASFIEIGEETGDLGRLAAQGATRAETFVRNSIKRAMALLAPALTALMGLLTAGVIAAVMTGVLSLNDAIY